MVNWEFVRKIRKCKTCKERLKYGYIKHKCPRCIRIEEEKKPFRIKR